MLTGYPTTAVHRQTESARNCTVLYGVENSLPGMFVCIWRPTPDDTNKMSIFVTFVPQEQWKYCITDSEILFLSSGTNGGNTPFVVGDIRLQVTVSKRYYLISLFGCSHPSELYLGLGHALTIATWWDAPPLYLLLDRRGELSLFEAISLLKTAITGNTSIG